MGKRELVITIRRAGNEIVHRLDSRIGGKLIVEFEPNGTHSSLEGAVFSRHKSQEHFELLLEEALHLPAPLCYTGSGKLLEYCLKCHRKPDEPSFQGSACHRKRGELSGKL